MTNPTTKSRHSTHRSLSHKFSYNDMTTKTKVFIQKICYKRTASIDMTKNGFIKYSSVINPINLLLKPLKDQLQKILGKKEESTLCSIKRKILYPTLHVRKNNAKRRSKPKSKAKHTKKKSKKPKHKK